MTDQDCISGLSHIGVLVRTSYSDTESPLAIDGGREREFHRAAIAVYPIELAAQLGSKGV
jgi:hypothetical protein